MKRDEQITKEANERYNTDAEKNIFEHGVHWSDENPIIKCSAVDPFDQLTFDVNFPGFAKEACENCNGGVYAITWNILNNLIGQVAQRATELHDPVLDALMIKLNLYELKNEERRKMISKLQQIYTEQVSE